MEVKEVETIIAAKEHTGSLNIDQLDSGGIRESDIVVVIKKALPGKVWLDEKREQESNHFLFVLYMETIF